MIRASWNNQPIAESTDTITVEGNHYFPRRDVNEAYLEPSDHRTHCHWKGEAHYYHVVVDGQRNENAAWYYPEPLPEAGVIRDRLAFWHGVQVS